MKISRVLHAGYVFESGQTQILFDPIFENPFGRNCYAFPDVRFDYDKIRELKPDAVFISHYHDDHCSMQSLNYINRDVPVYLYCIHEELFELIKQLGFKNVFSLTTDQTVSIGSFKVTPRLALDPEVDSLFQITAEGLNILNVVDAWIDPQAMNILKNIYWDMILWPFQTMREIEVIAPELSCPPELPFEWLEQIKELKPKYIVPSSCQFIHEDWSWYRQAYFPISYNEFENKVNAVAPECKVVRMNPGVTVELSKEHLNLTDPLSFITPIGDQDVDYKYDPNIIPAPVAKPARHFQAPNNEQKNFVLNFCKSKLVQTYNSLHTGLSGEWRLNLYDHLGMVTSYCYRIQDGAMSLTDETFDHWVTEVAVIKLYNALECGEALSSMYVQMRGLPHGEVSDDPLVSCLFNKDPLAYQKYQLNSLLCKNK